jgi:UDP-GlcNAc:undecaprenyl-phosphate GlcNAc-1-phosphate transferase
MGHSPVQAVTIFYLWTAMISLACLLVFTTQSFFWPTIVALSGGVLALVVTLTPIARVRQRVAQRGLLRLSGAPTRGHADERTLSD